MAVQTEPRRAMRPELSNSDDPRARAAARAALIREQTDGLDDAVDEFNIRHLEPDGWTYEWKVLSVTGKEISPSVMTSRSLHGWEAVSTSRHPELMPRGSTNPIIERGGLVLMERPAEITEDARRKEVNEARADRRQKEEQLNSAPQGQFERKGVHGESMVKVSKSYGPVEIPA